MMKRECVYQLITHSRFLMLRNAKQKNHFACSQFKKSYVKRLIIDIDYIVIVDNHIVIDVDYVVIVDN